MLASPEFADCLLAKSGIRFYAGSPLTTRDGYVLGAMCVLDQNPRTITPTELASLNDFAAMVMAQIELEHDFGRVDPLSGLPNRHQFDEDLEDEERQHPGVSRVALLIDLADPNQFRDSVNVLGTSYIDNLVRSSTRIIKSVLGRKRGIYHVATSSFAVLLGDQDGVWPEIVDRLFKSLSGQVISEGIPVTTDPVFGIAPFVIGETRPRDVLRTAIAAAHDARRLEIPHAVYSPDSDQANLRRFTLLNDISAAVKRTDELALVYQPRVELRTGVCVSAEALLRWQHPTLGNISPGEFIPLVEQTALAQPVTKWVLDTALRQVSRWRRGGIDIRVSINISARNLEEPDFASDLRKMLREHAVSTKEIELEFTESALIRNRSRVIAQLEVIRAMGIELAIDDFGTGYSSFSYLNKFPATTMKIDQSFIRTLEQSSVEEKLVRSMITMAHDIGYRAVAEGVETAEVYRMLAQAGCDEVQGYFISRPLAPGAFESWLKGRRDALTVSALQLLSNGSMSSHLA
jgi:EAL domain-containing protein (putative c-di-GMP-specific phosphodiesterase class I)/GGDEF domain-containing protein